MAQSILNEFLQKEMDRKEFLLFLGLLLFTVTGVSGLVQTVSRLVQSDQKHPTSGFGSGPYGV